MRASGSSGLSCTARVAQVVAARLSEVSIAQRVAPMAASKLVGSFWNAAEYPLMASANLRLSSRSLAEASAERARARACSRSSSTSLPAISLRFGSSSRAAFSAYTACVRSPLAAYSSASS